MIKKLFARKIIWITPVVLVILGFGAYFIYVKYFKTASETSSEPALQTAVARRGESNWPFVSRCDARTPVRGQLRDAIDRSPHQVRRRADK